MPDQKIQIRTEASESSGIKIGALGCADILRESLLELRNYRLPVTLFAIASRDIGRARAFATEHAIPRHYGSYDEMLEDPDVELVYNTLPNGMHCEWTIRALHAGKHVLCQKPAAANAAQAARMAAAVAETGRIFIEAWHYRHHPVARRIEAIVRSGVLGKLRSVETHFQVPGAWVTAGPDNIRFSYPLAGGAMMDPGCYCVHLLRWVTGEEPEVLAASARLHSEQIDSAMEAELRFPSGIKGRLVTSLDYSGDKLDEWLKVSGDNAELEVVQPCMPHWGEHFIHLRRNGSLQTEQLDRTSGFVHMFRDVARIIRDGAPNPATIEDGIRTMRVIDSIYRAAGMQPRGS
jgi:predicted dehydrogenase